MQMRSAALININCIMKVASSFLFDFCFLQIGRIDLGFFINGDFIRTDKKNDDEDDNENDTDDGEIRKQHG